jgi:hypothetical protein
MYAYDPAIKQTSKVLDGLEWLDSANCLPSLKRLLDHSASQSSRH